MTNDLRERRFMYHNFPRRRSTENVLRKGLTILRLLVEHGLLLTPEIQRWRDSKVSPGQSEEYTQVSS
jgi:hypothetical protein